MTLAAHDLLDIQNLVLRVSPGLLPIVALLYSGLSSWHCTLMCGSFAFSDERAHLHRLFGFRVVGYTVVGAVMGGLGQALKASLEYQMLNVLAFLSFVALTVILILPQLLPRLAFSRFLPQLRRGVRDRVPSSVRGLLMASIPCHLLGFYYGLAALLASPVLGGLLLFGHAVMSTPALAYAWQLTQKIPRASQVLRVSLKCVMVAMVSVNLLYLAGRLLYPADQVRQHFFFCW